MKIKRASSIIIFALFITSLNSATANTATSMNDVKAALDKLKTVGQADMRWLMFPLYRVTLKTPDGRYQPERMPLITATGQQWQRLGVDGATRAKWLKSLRDIWPSVKRGESLTLKVDKAGKGYFLHNGKVIGELKDKQFSRRFLDIWLSPKTSQPGLRQRLIGAFNETS